MFSVSTSAAAPLHEDARSLIQHFEGDSPLITHRALTKLYLAARHQPDEYITHQDIVNLPALIDSENARNPGLNLQYSPSVCIFKDQLCDLMAGNHGTLPHQPYRGRVILRVSPDSLHHAVVDVYYQAGQPLSLILPDSTYMDAQFATAIEAALMHRGVACRFGADGTTVQKSNHDCVMFSLSFALKLHDHAAWFSPLHERQIQHPNYRWSMHDGGVPAAFYKHSHSRTALHLALEHNAALAQAVVNKHGETLVARQSRHMGQCTGSRFEGTREYSQSIERKRLVFIERALRHDALNPAPQPDVGATEKLKRELLLARAKLG